VWRLVERVKGQGSRAKGEKDQNPGKEEEALKRKTHLTIKKVDRRFRRGVPF